MKIASHLTTTFFLCNSVTSFSFSQNTKNEIWLTKEYIVYKDSILQQKKYIAQDFLQQKLFRIIKVRQIYFKVQYCLSSLVSMVKTMKVATAQSIRRFEMEEIIPLSSFNYKGYSGKGVVEIGKDLNTAIPLQVLAKEPGRYAIGFRYANGNGPMNTSNKCAIRTLKKGNSYCRYGCISAKG